MPFALCNALITLQILMNKVFAAEVNQFIFVYLDDILIFSNSVEEHWKHLDISLERLGKPSCMEEIINVNSSRPEWTTSGMSSARKEFTPHLRK